MKDAVLKKIEPYILKDGEEYMNDDQRKHFQVILESWRDALVDEGQKTVSNMQDEALNLPDPNDRATQEEGFSLELRTRDRERKLIAKIDKTLRRLGLDDYGYCDMCGIEIGIKRLEARPTAELCIDCKEVEERREKSRMD